MDVALPPMNPEVARLRRKAAQRKFVKHLRYVRFLWGIAGLLLILLAIEALLVLTISPRFWIYRVTVNGGDTLTTPEIIRLVGVPAHSNFYRVSLWGMGQRLINGDPRVRKVRVSRGQIGELIIRVDERRPVCRLGQTNPPQYLDLDSMLFPRPVEPQPPVPVVEGTAVQFTERDFGKPVTADRVRTVVACLQAMYDQFGQDAPLDIARITLGATGRITLVLRQGTRILLGAPDHLTEKMYVIRNTILYASTKEGYALDRLEYIDARAVTRAAGLAADYKPRSDQEGASQ